MPFNPDKPPVGKINGLSKLSDNKQRQWVHVFNSSLAKGDSEETAIKKAWGATKKGGKVKTAERLIKGFEKVARGKVYENTAGLTVPQLREQLHNLKSNRDEDTWTSGIKNLLGGVFGAKPVTPSTINNSERVVKNVRPEYVFNTTPNGPSGYQPTTIRPSYFENIIRNNIVKPIRQGSIRSRYGLGWF